MSVTREIMEFKVGMSKRNLRQLLVMLDRATLTEGITYRNTELGWGSHIPPRGNDAGVRCFTITRQVLSIPRVVFWG